MAPFKHLHLARYRFSSTFYGNACGKNLSRVSTLAILWPLSRKDSVDNCTVTSFHYTTLLATAVAVSLPTLFLFVCLFVCLFVFFFFGEANKIKIKNISSRILQFLVFSCK